MKFRSLAFGRVSGVIYEPETGRHIATVHVADAGMQGPFEQEAAEIGERLVRLWNSAPETKAARAAERK